MVAEPTIKVFSDAELAKVFPEAKVVIPQLIAELKQKHKALVRDIEAQEKAILIQSDDDAYRYFWRKWLTVTLGAELEEVDKNIARLERQLRAMNGLKPSNGLTDDMIRFAKAVPVETVVNQQFRRTGSTLVGHCPFHQERTPSFHIFKSNRGKCFGGCGKGGDVIDIYMELQNCSFKDAVFALSGGYHDV